MPNLVILIFVTGFAIRFLLSFLPGFQNDLGAFLFWSARLAESGPWNFYQAGFFADYAPGYLYVLALIGSIAKVLSISETSIGYAFLLKLPPILFDLLSAYLLYRLLAGQKTILRTGAVALYLFHPAVLFLGPVWGQVDSALSFFLLLTCFFLSRDRPLKAGLALTLAFWIKPQALAIVPIFVFFFLKKYPLKLFLKASLIAFCLSTLIVLPFFPTAPWRIIEQLSSAASVYPDTSFFAYNFWALYGMFQSDAQTFLGFSLRNWGFLLFLGSLAPLPFLLKRPTALNISLGFSLSVMTFFLFVTRMHERYLFPFLILFLVACVLANKKSLWVIFLTVSSYHFLNLYVAYAYYNDNILKIEWLFGATSLLSRPLAVVVLLSYVILMIILVRDRAKE